MKRQLFFGTLFAAALSVGISAQTPTPQTPTTQTPTTSTPQQGSRSKSEVTLTGCLQSGSGSSATGTTGTASKSAMSGGEFILANAKMASSSGSSPAGTAGKPSETSSASTSDKYKLVGHESDLRKNANSQVEVKGAIDTKGSSASAASSSGEPTLRVSSVKQISPSCSGGN
jgi:hypothetical protein